MRLSLLLPLTVVCALSSAQSKYDTLTDAMAQKGLNELGAYHLLEELSGGIGPRLSGSPSAAKAVEWGQTTMKRLGFQNVHLVPCMVPHWVRGDKESLDIISSDGSAMPLSCCALGMSYASPDGGVTAEVVEVHSLDEASKLGDKAKGKIVFYNGPMPAQLTNTFGAYGAAGGQRFRGPVTAARLGAVGAIVRSMTLALDDFPHTGVTEFGPADPKIPAVAVSLVAADRLHDELQKGSVTVKLVTHCQVLPDEPSANVVGEIVGSEKPNEVIVMGGHLDSWDLGRGAHDDGAGIVQSLEALRLLHDLGWKPKRTIRVVLWMNEENGGRGADAYVEYAKKATEKHIAGMESDSGGFAPRGFGVSLQAKKAKSLDKWLPALSKFEIERFYPGGEGGADVDGLADVHAVVFGLAPESQRYFDYHHSDKDTIDKVNPRELELGAM
ncbi:MAG: M20/M25/M40 family metallo-hydrolase, partial [Armatimonadota bacterium]